MESLSESETQSSVETLDVSPEEIISETTTLMEMRSASEIENSVEKLLQELRDVVHDGEELLKAGIEDSSEQSSVAREKLAAALEAAKETQRRIQERAAEGLRATDRAIREHPYQSVGVAFGVGLLIGVIACRK